VKIRPKDVTRYVSTMSASCDGEGVKWRRRRLRGFRLAPRSSQGTPVRSGRPAPATASLAVRQIWPPHRPDRFPACGRNVRRSKPARPNTWAFPYPRHRGLTSRNTALSRLKQGFDSPRERQGFQRLSRESPALQGLRPSMDRVSNGGRPLALYDPWAAASFRRAATGEPAAFWRDHRPHRSSCGPKKSVSP
jgi:hypothetical protein